MSETRAHDDIIHICQELKRRVWDQKLLTWENEQSYTSLLDTHDKQIMNFLYQLKNYVDV